jgi:hypothetical protein
MRHDIHLWYGNTERLVPAEASAGKANDLYLIYHWLDARLDPACKFGYDFVVIHRGRNLSQQLCNL